MTREQLQQEFAQARAEKEALSAVVDPLRAERDAVVAQMVPLEKRAADLAGQIREHMPVMSEIDKRLSRLARLLGHPRVGGLPQGLRR